MHAALGSGRCHYHPERSGIGICVECRSVICAECTTQFEGINRCATCLKAKLAKASTLLERKDWTVHGVTLGLLGVGSLYAGVLMLAKLFG